MSQDKNPRVWAVGGDSFSLWKSSERGADRSRAGGGRERSGNNTEWAIVADVEKAGLIERDIFWLIAMWPKFLNFKCYNKPYFTMWVKKKSVHHAYFARQPVV